MDIVSLIAALLKEGIPDVELLIATWQSKTPPDQATWDALHATKTTARQQAIIVLAAAGVDPASAKGQSFLALIPPAP